jgi:hypothetical protein
MGDDVPIDSETLLVTEFMNLKIKTAQSFRGVSRDKMCVHVFVEVSARMLCFFEKKSYTATVPADSSASVPLVKVILASQKQKRIKIQNPTGYRLSALSKPKHKF